MFEDSVLENRIARKRSWTTVLSFALECLGISVLVLIPLIYTEAIPNLSVMTKLEPPVAPPAPRPIEVIATERMEHRNTSEFQNDVLIAPRTIPPRINTIVDTAPPAQAPSADQLGVIGATGSSGTNNSIIAEIIRPRGPVVAPSLKPPLIIRISHLDEGQIVRRVQPVYPAIARTVHAQGAVILEAVIDKDGRIENLKVVSGHPYLISSALNAVRQWRYRPYLLNGSPVEVQTTITVNFYLNSN